MGLEEIEQRIKESGKKEGNKIMAEANDEIGKIMEEAETEAKKIATEARDQIKKEGELTFKRIIADARLTERKIIEDKKSELVQKVFDESMSRVLKMGEKEKIKILNRYIKEGREGVKNSVVFVDKKYKGLVKAKVTDLGDFGVVVESSDGSSRVDNTLDKLIERAKQNLKPKIVKTLFAENAPDRR